MTATLRRSRYARPRVALRRLRCWTPARGERRGGWELTVAAAGLVATLRWGRP